MLVYISNNNVLVYTVYHLFYFIFLFGSGISYRNSYSCCFFSLYWFECSGTLDSQRYSRITELLYCRVVIVSTFGSLPSINASKVSWVNHSEYRCFTPGCFSRNSPTSTKTSLLKILHAISAIDSNLLCVAPHQCPDLKSFFFFLSFVNPFCCATLSFHS